MRSIYIALFSSLILLLTACSKDSEPSVLPDGSVSIQQAATKDTVEIAMPILSDSVAVIGLTAALSGATDDADHWIEFAVDTTKILDYRSQYGDAEVLPYSSYLVYRSMTRIAAGATISDSAQINIVQQTKLEGFTTYVLPVVIHSVDGDQDAAGEQVLYLVIKTGKPAVISKSGWTIQDYSSYYSTLTPDKVLDDNNTTTYWANNITLDMPQWLTINFNKTITFTAVTYYLPTALKYPTLGGYPTSIKIETSIDGTSWTDNGTYAGDISNNMQTLNTGEVTGRYLRFTALACVKYASAYNAVFISGISLVP